MVSSPFVPSIFNIVNEFLLNDTPVKVWAKYVDPHAWKEIDNISRLPFVYHHLAFMPDVHGGMGMPIGGVLATKKVVIPNAVGVDIGCGMCAIKTDIIADEINFVDSRGDSAGASQSSYTPDAYSAPSFSSDLASAPKFEELKTDDDLPF